MERGHARVQMAINNPAKPFWAWAKTVMAISLPPPTARLIHLPSPPTWHPWFRGLHKPICTHTFITRRGCTARLCDAYTEMAVSRHEAYVERATGCQIHVRHTCTLLNNTPVCNLRQVYALHYTSSVQVLKREALQRGSGLIDGGGVFFWGGGVKRKKTQLPRLDLWSQAFVYNAIGPLWPLSQHYCLWCALGAKWHTCNARRWEAHMHINLVRCGPRPRLHSVRSRRANASPPPRASRKSTSPWPDTPLTA